MHWPTITVDVDEDLKDAVVSEFASDGIVGVWETPGSGDAVTLILYFEEGRVPLLVDARIGRICEKNGTAAPHIDRGFQEQQDWTREWRRRYKSFPVGYGFQIVPSWEAPPSQDGRIVIRIDPRQAFGTGAHETTEMLLEALEEFPPGAHLLDLGTGSGILAIAAQKLGWRVVVGADIDPYAVGVASGNVRTNEADVALYCGTVAALGASSADLILANLSLDVIDPILGELATCLAPGGRIVLSGVLDSQVDRLRERLREEGMPILRELGRGEWVAMIVGDGD